MWQDLILPLTSYMVSDQIRSVAQSCPTLCDSMNHSTPGLPVHHQLLEFTETHTVLGVTKSQTWLSERVQSSLAEEEGKVNYLGSTLGHSLSSPTLYMHDRVMPDCWRFSFYPHLHSNYFHYFLVKIGKKNKQSFLLLSRFQRELVGFCRLTRWGFWEVGTWPHRDTLKVLFCGWASTFLSSCH